MQETDTWCWAASAVNAVLFRKGHAANYFNRSNQESAVYAATGSYTYSGVGYLADIDEAATYAAGGSYTYTPSNSSANWDEIVSYIMRNKAVIAGGGKYSGSTRTGGHIFMIFKVDTTNELVYFVDPWISFTTETARRKYCTYDEFMAGCSATMQYKHDCAVYQN